MTCAFCVIPTHDVVFEDEHTWVLLHQDWSPRGHAMVVARRHVENASSLDAEEWQHLAGVWHRAERAILEATGAERAIILKLGILTPHLHIHIYPVSSEATRSDVFAAFDGKGGVGRDEVLVKEIQRRLFPAMM